MDKLVGLFERVIEPGQCLEQSRQRFSNVQLFRLIMPILVERMLLLLVGIIDTFMISYAGEAAISGVSLINQLNGMLISVFGALVAGGTVISSQYVGSGDRESGIRSANQLVMITTLCSVLIAAGAIIFNKELLGALYGDVESDVMLACRTYLVITAFSYPFLAVYNSCAALFRSMNKTSIVMKVSVAMNVLNVAGNIIGIFVLRAGVAGVAFPTLISTVFSSLVLLTLMFSRKNTLYLRVKDIFAWNGTMLRRILGIAVPSGIEQFLFQGSKVALCSLVALFGTTQIASYGVAQGWWSMSSLFCSSLSLAFVTVIGQCMGASDKEAAVYYSKKLLRITYAGGAVWNMLVFAVSPLALAFYDLEPETVRCVIILIAIHNTFNIVFWPTASPLSQGLRSAGDVRYTMYAAVFSTVICRVVFSIALGVWLKLGVYGVALGMVGDWIVKTALIVPRWTSGSWLKFKLI